MKITAHLSLWFSLAFAILCIAYGLVGFNSVDGDATATLREDANGYAMFWLFLGGVGLVCAAGSWWLIRTGADASGE